MTTIVYTEEVTTTQSPNSSPRNVQKFTVKIMESSKSGEGRNGQRAGSPKPQKKFSVRHTRKEAKSKSHSFELQSHFSSGYNPHMFTITAYLPYDGGRRLKLQCTPGMTVQQVIETEIPDISRTGYQVYQFPSRALLNPEKDASVLQDQEISIEPMRLQSPDEAEDERLGIVRELLRTEDAYLENLRNIFDIYMEPLRKWGLQQTDMNTLFRSLSRLCDLLMNFFSELELAVQYWNTTTTQIGGLFKQYASFWDMYEEYAQSYTKACKLLKEKRMVDESFNRFLEMKRGAAMHTLESLMLLPVQRIYDYHRLLVQLYSITPKDHLDYHDLRFTVACVSQMVQARERQLSQFHNETKLEQVQLRFSTDNLHLSHTLGIMESPSRRSNKNTNSPALLRTPSHLKKHSVDFSDGLEMERRAARIYLQEGPVKIITGLQSHERFMFLFDDLLLIAKATSKPKSQHRSYKLKHRLRLSEMWVTDCMDEVLVSSLPPNTCFIIGWPIVNCVASFSSPEEKTLWHGLLSKHIHNQRQTVQPDSVSIRIVNLTKSSNNLPQWMQVHSSEQARDVLSRALDQFAIAVSENNCQIWVKFSKEEGPYPLIGHEYPFAIQMHHNRQQMDVSGDTRPTQLQFIIKRKTAIPTETQTTPQQPRLLRTFKSSAIVSWYKGRRHGREGVSSSRQKSKHRLFGAPLDTIIINEQLPEILQEMLIRLYTEGPSTLGIFRQSANHRKVKELKESINNREQVDLSDISIHVVGALLKEILRNVPGGILVSSRYTEFVATNDIKDVSLRVQHIQRSLSRLPIENQIFLQYLMPLLHYISINEEINCMNSINLAICFAPSILWPDSGLDVIKNEVPPLVQFMVEHTPQIFGSDLPELYKQAKLPSGSSLVESMEYSLDPQVRYVPTKVEDGSHRFGHRRTDSLETASTSDESAGEEEPVSNLRKARSSGITVSDSQLSQISQYDGYEYHGRTGAVELSGKHILQQQTKPADSSTSHAFPTPKRVKRVRPERSHSYRGPNDRSPQQKHKYRSSVTESNNRRKSIATQPQRKHMKPSSDFLPSSNSSPGSAHAFSSVREESLDEDSEDTLYQDQDKLPHKRPSLKRKTPQHSHSFSKNSENMPAKPPLPTSVSTSFYDKLLPLDHEARLRSRSLNSAHVLAMGLQTAVEEEPEPVANMTWPADQIPSSMMSSSRTPPTSGPKGMTNTAPPHPYASSQSITSNQSASSSGSLPYVQQLPPYYPQKRPSNLSLASSGYSGDSAEALATGSPDMLAQLEQTPFDKLDPEFIKLAISKRFGISSMDWPKSSPQEVRGPYGSFTTSTPYGYGESGRTPVKTGKKEVFPQEEVSIDTIQRKLQERRRLSSKTSDSLSAGKKNNHSTDTLNIDDRPEADQHQNSLPRLVPELSRPQQYVQPEEHDHNRLYPGYNSDTESSPSRTLNRPEKLKEVTSPGIISPTKSSMPPRYMYKAPGAYPYYPYADTRRLQQYERGKKVQEEAAKRRLLTEKQTTPPAEPKSTSTSEPKGTPTSERQSTPSAEPQGTLTPTVDPKSIPSSEPKSTSAVESKPATKTHEVQPQLVEHRSVSQPVLSDERPVLVSKRPSSAKTYTVGQKKAEREEKVRGERSPKTVSKYSDPIKRRELFARERALSNVEEAKMKLGLLPPRQRSKSMSESEAMRIIQKVVEEDEENEERTSAMKSAADEERAEKHKEWLSYAPTSTERKQAWEHLSKHIPKLQTREVRSRSLKHDSPVLPRKFTYTQQPSPKAERKHKSSTMPEYLAEGRNGNRRLGTGLVRTVKITTREIPEPQRIRRINLRTYH